jgi:hypothetical protein
MTRSSVFNVTYRLVASAEDRAVAVIADLRILLFALSNRAHFSATYFLQRNDVGS